MSDMLKGVMAPDPPSTWCPAVKWDMVDADVEAEAEAPSTAIRLELDDDEDERLRMRLEAFTAWTQLAMAFTDVVSLNEGESSAY